MEIIQHTATDAWLVALEHVITAGSVCFPRGLGCHELFNAHTVFPMHKPIVTVTARELGYRFMFAEAWWILSGDNRVETIAPFSKAISKFSDNGATFFGAYGPKIQLQVQGVIEKLAKDHYTRQAVINIWRENPPITRDTPCTLSVQFLARIGTDGKWYLHCIDNMRSSDVWLGWPYDVFNFSMLTSYVILELRKQYGIEFNLGNIHMNLGSLHIYDINVEQGKKCIAPPYNAERKFRYPILNPLEEWVDGEDLIAHLYAVSHKRPDLLKSEWVHCVAEGKHDKIKE
jgi:thymidylate synthase